MRAAPQKPGGVPPRAECSEKHGACSVRRLRGHEQVKPALAPYRTKDLDVLTGGTRPSKRTSPARCGCHRRRVDSRSYRRRKWRPSWLRQTHRSSDDHLSLCARRRRMAGSVSCRMCRWLFDQARRRQCMGGWGAVRSCRTLSGVENESKVNRESLRFGAGKTLSGGLG